MNYKECLHQKSIAKCIARCYTTNRLSKKKREEKSMKSIKRCIIMGLMVTTMATFAVGCGKKVACDFCGNVAVCKEIDFYGETLYICQECLSDFN
jgi:hypothetical protein